MVERPYTLLSCGMSIDGYLDDAAQERLLLSNDADFDRVEKLEAWSAEQGRSLTEVALSWLASQPEVASVIAGASRPEQVTENAAATRTDLTVEEIAELGALMD